MLFNYAHRWIVLYFGGQSLDTDPVFGRYWHFCGTLIDIRTDRNQQQDNLQLKESLNESIVEARSSKMELNGIYERIGICSKDLSRINSTLDRRKKWTQ